MLRQQLEMNEVLPILKNQKMLLHFVEVKAGYKGRIEIGMDVAAFS